MFCLNWRNEYAYQDNSWQETNLISDYPDRTKKYQNFSFFVIQIISNIEIHTSFITLSLNFLVLTQIISFKGFTGFTNFNAVGIKEIEIFSSRFNDLATGLHQFLDLVYVFKNIYYIAQHTLKLETKIAVLPRPNLIECLFRYHNKLF